MILKNFVVIFITTLTKKFELKKHKKERREKKNKPLAFLYFGGFYCKAFSQQLSQQSQDWVYCWLQPAIWRKRYKTQQNWILFCMHGFLCVTEKATKIPSPHFGFFFFKSHSCFLPSLCSFFWITEYTLVMWEADRAICFQLFKCGLYSWIFLYPALLMQNWGLQDT